MTQRRRLEVLSFGETIIDFLPNRRARLRDVESFRKIVGGAPANVAMGLARLGRAAGLMGKVGRDEFGHFLRESLEREGVDTEAVIMTDEASTGFTFVSIAPDGERSFTAPRAITADQTLRPDEVDLTQLDRADVFIFGSNQMVAQCQREASLLAMRTARERDRFVVFDPNVRMHLWADPDEAREVVLEALAFVDLVKLNDEEIEYLGQGLSARAFHDEVLAPAGVTALIHTQASGGAEVHCGPLTASAHAPQVEVVDTTGAGDGFVAGVVAGLCARTEDQGRRSEQLRALLRGWDAHTWKRVLSLGCFVGSHVCTTLGATTGLPTADEIPWDEFL